MKCENCAGSEGVNNYSIHYGANKTDVDVGLLGLSEVTKVTERRKYLGSEQVNICNLCIDNYAGKETGNVRSQIKLGCLAMLSSFILVIVLMQIKDAPGGWLFLVFGLFFLGWFLMKTPDNIKINKGQLTDKERIFYGETCAWKLKSRELTAKAFVENDDLNDSYKISLIHSKDFNTDDW